MSRTKYEDSCSGCRPVLLDPKSGKVWADDSPAMHAVMHVWEGTTREEREAFHRVTCLNSRRFYDVHIMQQISQRISEELNKME